MEATALSPVEKKLRGAALYAFYGELLTPSQREPARLYFNEDLSLSEIAEQTGISRQGAHEAIARAAQKLEGLEDTLKLRARFERTETHLRACRELLKTVRAAEGSEQALQKAARLIDLMLSEEEE